MKPNSNLLYINSMSNHPKAVITLGNLSGDYLEILHLWQIFEETKWCYPGSLHEESHKKAKLVLKRVTKKEQEI